MIFKKFICWLRGHEFVLNSNQLFTSVACCRRCKKSLDNTDEHEHL